MLLGGLLIVLTAVVMLRGGRQPAAPANPSRPASNTEGRRPDPADDLDVRIETLQAQRGGPEAIERNPFRFEARRAPAGGDEEGPGRRPAPGREVVPPPQAPSGPPPPPPIPLKFIGIIESAGVGRMAALSDGRHVFHGRAGDIIEGRYRIVRIGVESIVLEYVDGGTQQTIRLSGQ
jgi:hypothetical protein